jgi:hypothetical protein
VKYIGKVQVQIGSALASMKQFNLVDVQQKAITVLNLIQKALKVTDQAPKTFSSSLVISLMHF